ncbi:MAG: type I DNA topoisomerase [Bacteroidetes bacterium]|nr:type I DNA topoisomerase [Bacteroidota bacterium]
MPKNIVIVESPAKAKTIEKYLGEDYKVASSYGHVRDLPKGDGAIDIENGYVPTYEISPDKKAVIKSLKELIKDSDIVYLASDDDREGEAISWHLMEVLDLDDKNTRRIVFHEITKNAIEHAIQNPRGIDLDLVNAQQARRVLDRLVGFELSPILWRKIKTGLSAGRVQSVAVRLVVEREREITGFKPRASFKITAIFDLGETKQLVAELPEKLSTEDEVYAFFEDCKGAEFRINSLQKTPAKKTPAPPFTTSTLQQEASIKLGFSVSQTMTIAQKLYESGKISYMRTDSVNLSQEAIQGASSTISQNFGSNYLKIRNYKTKTAGAQEAHEAIRPTNFDDSRGSNDQHENKLYELIWKRVIASQMADAELERTTATIGISTSNRNLMASGEVVKFDGFLKVYSESFDEEDSSESDQKEMLPPLNEGQLLSLMEMKSREIFSRPPARYTEASLVKKLEEMGIGRPSTYAPTISTIQKREYVQKESREGKERDYKLIKLKDNEITSQVLTEVTGAEKKKMFPTNIAMVVNDFLVENFPNVTNYSFTADIEKELDDIAQGKIKWNEMIDNFYQEFHSKVEITHNIERSSVGSARELGTDPASGKSVYTKLGKFGPYVQIGESINGDEQEEKPRYASLRKDQLIESITLEEALELFKLPRDIGEFEGMMMTAAIGKYGPYIKRENKFYSLEKSDDPITVTVDRAIEIIEAKRKADSEKFIKVFEENPEVMVLKGRWGPYIKAGNKNVKIPKGKVPEELTLEECLELAANAPEKKGRFRRK